MRRTTLSRTGTGTGGRYRSGTRYGEATVTAVPLRYHRTTSSAHCALSIYRDTIQAVPVGSTQRNRRIGAGLADGACVDHLGRATVQATRHDCRLSTRVQSLQLKGSQLYFNCAGCMRRVCTKEIRLYSVGFLIITTEHVFVYQHIT